MTAPYKIAVAAAATLLLVVIASLLLEKPPASPGIDGPPAADGVAMAGGRSAPPPPESIDPYGLTPPPDPFDPKRIADPTVGTEPRTGVLPGATPAPALPFGDPTRSAPGTPPGPTGSGAPTDPTPPLADPARLEYTDAPPAEVFDVGRTAFDAEGNPRPSLFDPQPDAAPATTPAATPTTVTPTPGVPLGPGDLVPRPATPTLPGAGAPPVAPTAKLPTYTIKSGDSLTLIALELYGSGNHWVQIAQANPLVDPDRLKVGQVIKLPGAPGTTPVIPPAPIPTPDRAPAPDVGAGTQYTVKENDTLSGIAKQFYNAASKWQLIYEANRQAIGSEPGRMKPGTVLRIPPPDSGAR